MQPKPTVYVVDDDEAMRDSLRWLIESADLDVETYAGAQDFLDAYDGKKPACLVLDLRMPNMSGLELQDALASRNITIPIIFITAHGEIKAAVRAMKGGAVDFISKPFSDQLLLDRIQQAIKNDGAAFP
jgi:two-component system response regulator FixJ